MMDEHELVAELQKIFDLLKNKEPGENEQYRRGWLEGRAFQITTDLDEHPEFWEGRACGCAECQDDVADYC